MCLNIDFHRYLTIVTNRTRWKHLNDTVSICRPLQCSSCHPIFYIDQGRNRLRQRRIHLDLNICWTETFHLQVSFYISITNNCTTGLIYRPLQCSCWHPIYYIDQEWDRLPQRRIHLDLNICCTETFHLKVSLYISVTNNCSKFPNSIRSIAY